MSGYTNIEAWKLFTLTGIAGSIYIGTIISFIKIGYHKQKNIFIKYNFFLMTIIGMLCTIYGWYNVSMSHNLFYNIDLGIIVGFAISTVICDRIRKNSNLLLKLKT